MFDIGFVELVLVGVVALLVIGPERMPGAVRTTMGWVRHIRRSIGDIKTEIEQDLHNDKILSELRQAKQDVERGTADITTSLNDAQNAIGDTKRSLERDLSLAADKDERQPQP
ncbi:MAG: twin-arginine translocase subunit TatB [Gammaproteobacteria bacterium]|nr:MAG: twin-arginine translocase subunit TatB [Gammaproteobacteria bacterium]